jgi:hypothetical protein
MDTVERRNKLTNGGKGHRRADGGFEAGLVEAVGIAVNILKPSSLCIMSRKPLMDEDCPEVPEIDLISIWNRTKEYPQRMTVLTSFGKVYVDVLWVPISAMIDPLEAAGYRMLPHLFVESEVIWSKPGFIGPLIDEIRANAYKKAIWEKRLSSQLTFGDSAFQEAKRNLSFPPIALFFFQTAHAYYMVALGNAIKESVTSLMTKPITKLRRMDAVSDSDLEEILLTNLHLELEPTASIIALSRVYDAVRAKCNPHMVRGMSERTRGHYTYSLSSLELEYRLAVAEALSRKGDFANANFYLRFWAYSLARCPIVCEEAKQGRNPSFYVPFNSFNKSISKACSEIIEPVSLIFGDVSSGEVEESLRGTVLFRARVTEKILEKGLTPNLK